MTTTTTTRRPNRRTMAAKYGKYWYKFRRNKLSLVGLGVIVVVAIIAIFAPYLAPYPNQAKGFYVNFPASLLSPSSAHLFGTDQEGRDVLTRVMFGFRYSLTLVIVVLGITVVPGVFLGLVAGYYVNSKLSNVIMRL